jgi:3-hydroxyacyl-[acyl-carrier-protein] dehydratase
MFLNQLYSILNTDSQESVLQMRIALNANHAIFEGHFPDMPILPGVVQLQIVKELLQTHFNTSLHAKEMKTCKFLKVIDPREVSCLQIDVKWVETSQVIEAVVTMKDEENTYLKAQISYTIV